MKSSFDTYITKLSPKNFNYNELIIADDSRYSCLMPWHYEQVNKILLFETKYLNISSIIDATGNIGCDSILFRLLFPDAEITTIELNTNTFNILNQNMNNLTKITNTNVKKIKTLNMNCLDYIYDNDADMIYVDPPWEGESYKQNQYFNLCLSGYEIGNIVNSLLYNYTLIVAKLPVNFDYHKFKSQVMYNINQPIYISYYTINTSSGKASYVLSFIRF